MISPDQIDLTSLPSLPLSDRKQLPIVSCIYLAIDSQNNVQYVGQSVNLRQRWLGHHRQGDLEGVEGVRIAWIEVSDIAFLNQIEQALIQWFSPPLNGLRAPKAAKSALRERMEAVNQSEIVMLPLSEILSIRWTDERREKLKRLRGNTNLVALAKTLAEYGISVSRQYLHRLESDPEVKGISPDLAEGLCQALKISLSELLFNERAPLAIWNK